METKQATPSTTVVYSKPNCPSCVKAKMLLDNKKIPYTESVIGKDIQVETLIKEFELNNLPMPRTAPQIILHGKYVGGYEQLVEVMENTGMNHNH
jgi:glutaredoxin 3|tara:strand:- start:22 stop:306 length:285 start_codon:yes stop_codon:yes gene_type:complete